MGDRLSPTGDAQLAVDTPHLAPDSVDREVKLLADLPGREPGRQQPQDDELPLGEGRAHRAPRAGGRSTQHPCGLFEQGRKHSGIDQPLDQFLGSTQQRPSSGQVTASVVHGRKQQLQRLANECGLTLYISSRFRASL